MKKRLALPLALVTLLGCFVGCGERVKEYTETPLTSLTYTSVDYNGGFTKEYLFDFEKNIATRHSFLPGDDENDRTETVAEFSEEQEKTLIDKLYTYGLFDIKKEYKSPPGIYDGGGWNLEIHYNDGTSKESSGSNNTPGSVFSKCAKAFFDICRDGVVAYVPSAYYTPPDVSYALHSTVEYATTSQGAPSLVERGNYKWNGFEETTQNYYRVNQNHPFPYVLDFENGTYEFVLYTANYGDYDRFRECLITSYDFNEKMSGEEIIIEKGWFKQIEFNLQPDKIYVVKLGFKNGDFVEYTFNTKMN